MRLQYFRDALSQNRGPMKNLSECRMRSVQYFYLIFVLVFLAWLRLDDSCNETAMNVQERVGNSNERFKKI